LSSKDEDDGQDKRCQDQNTPALRVGLDTTSRGADSAVADFAPPFLLGTGGLRISSPRPFQFLKLTDQVGGVLDAQVVRPLDAVLGLQQLDQAFAIHALVLADGEHCLDLRRTRVAVATPGRTVPVATLGLGLAVRVAEERSLLRLRRRGLAGGGLDDLPVDALLQELVLRGA